MYQAYMPYQYQQRQEYRQPFMTQHSGFNCIPVTSKAEAEVFQIPFDGSTTYFVDTANGKIYAKTFNSANGTAPLATFSRDAEAAAPEYVTKDTVDEIKQSINRLAEEIEKIKKPGKLVRKDDTD